MDTGKLSFDDLEDLVLKQVHGRRSDVLLAAGLGEDAAVLDLKGEYCVVSTDPITGASANIGRLAVVVACNDIIATGAEPIGLQVVILAPVGTPKAEIKKIMQEIDQEAAKSNVQILGGHTEISPGVNQFLVVITALGKTINREFIATRGAKVNDSLILTKGAALEGAGILAFDFYDELLAKGVPPHLLLEAQNYLSQISVQKEGLIAVLNKVQAMHDVTEGGVLGAAYEMAVASEQGFELWESEIYVSEAVAAICAALNLNPLALISSGAMLIATNNQAELLKQLEQESIKATVIGKIVAGKKILVDKTGKRISITEPPRDELWRFLDRDKCDS